MCLQKSNKLENTCTGDKSLVIEDTNRCHCNACLTVSCKFASLTLDCTSHIEMDVLDNTFRTLDFSRNQHGAWDIILEFLFYFYVKCALNTYIH